MINVRIDEDELLDMLMDRLAFWTDDDDATKLFEQYYENMINGGCFDGADLDIKGIVDNDYVNWLDVVYADDLDDYNIEDEEDDRIVTSITNEYGEKVYLVYCG